MCSFAHFNLELDRVTIDDKVHTQMYVVGFVRLILKNNLQLNRKKTNHRVETLLSNLYIKLYMKQKFYLCNHNKSLSHFPPKKKVFSHFHPKKVFSHKVDYINYACLL